MGLNNKRVRRCSRGSNGIFTRDSISFQEERRGKRRRQMRHWANSRSSGVGPTVYMILFFLLHSLSLIVVCTHSPGRLILNTTNIYSSPISGNRRRKISSTTSTTRCLLMNESANRSNESSTSSRMTSTSPVAKYLERTYGGTTSTMTRAHSRLMATTSSSEGGTRAGPSASSGKMARRMACKAGGSRAGFNTRAWMV